MRRAERARRRSDQRGLGERERPQRERCLTGREPRKCRGHRDEEGEQAGGEPHLAREGGDADAREGREDAGERDERQQHPERVHQAHRDGEEQESDQLDARVYALQKTGPSGDLLVLEDVGDGACK